MDLALSIGVAVLEIGEVLLLLKSALVTLAYSPFVGFEQAFASLDFVVRLRSAVALWLAPLVLRRPPSLFFSVSQSTRLYVLGTSSIPLVWLCRLLLCASAPSDLDLWPRVQPTSE